MIRRLCNCRMVCFNPHPARRPSATQDLLDTTLTEFLFQSSPGPKAECYPHDIAVMLPELLVSILTRPEGRVLRAQPTPSVEV